MLAANWPMKPGTRWTYRDTDEKGEVQDYKLYAPDIRRYSREAPVKLDKAAPKDGTGPLGKPKL
jgi:hypothetical protein